MKMFRIEILECVCGHGIILVPPKATTWATQFARANVSVLACTGQAAVCPGCGAPLETPAAELLDLERIPGGDRLLAIRTELARYFTRLE
jgi:hypothetical protein